MLYCIAARLLNVFATGFIVGSRLCNLTTSHPPSFSSFNKEKQLAAQRVESRGQIELCMNLFCSPPFFSPLLSLAALFLTYWAEIPEGTTKLLQLIVFFFSPSFLLPHSHNPPLSKCDCKQSAATAGDQNNLTPLSSFPLAAPKWLPRQQTE